MSPSSEGHITADLRPQNTPVTAMFEPGYEQLSGFLCVVQTVISLAGNKINNRTGQESFYHRAALFKMGEQTVTSLNPGVECVPSTKIVYENANSSPYKRKSNN